MNKNEQLQQLCICGEIQQIVYKNEENGYSVLRLLSDDDEEFTATGIIPNAGLGEYLRCIGHWATHPSYGEQFVVATVTRSLPMSVRGIAEYLGSGLLRGVGPKLATRIAEKFQEDTFDMLMNDPMRLTEIKGITDRKAREVGRIFTEMSEMRLLMDFLTENELPLSLTPPLYRRLGVSAIDALTENPYLLCDKEYDVDFRIADQLAGNLGLSKLSSERIDAGVLYTMVLNLDNGHSFVPAEKLAYAASHLLTDEECEVSPDRVMEGMDRMQACGMIVREDICKQDAVYLHNIHFAEEYLAQNMYMLSQRQYDDYDCDLPALLQVLEENSAMQYAAAQREAIHAAVTSGISILTGGPGTGKTTAVRGMLDAFDALGMQVLLAAPTGRAAKRLAELCDRDAMTIHRLLEAGFQGGGQLGFQRNANNPLDCDVVIIDEVSMVDIVLMQALTEALPYEARLVLVGDADQLPPVGPGNFLRDLINAKCIPTTQLTEIFRQAQLSQIVTNAHAINNGQYPTPSGREGDFFIMKKGNPQMVIETVVSLCKTRLPNYYKFDPAQIQVICPAKRHTAGTNALNTALQAALNPPAQDKAERKFGEIIFRKGDRVMQVRNNYDIIWENPEGTQSGTGMFNGDVGEIVEIFPAQECLVIRFDDKVATYAFDMLNELDLAYAVTVHKAQGSEFEAVVLAVADGISPRLLTRSILYTAITRAKRLLVLVGTQETIVHMVGSNSKNKRYSALRARLRQLEREA